MVSVGPFPNPLLLPFLFAGGAVSGVAFGMFYTVAMQLGYNYYGKKALVRLEDGEDLDMILADISKEIQPFSERMLNEALDKLPGIAEQGGEVAKNLLADAEESMINYIRVWLGLPELTGDFGSLPGGSSGGGAGTPPPPPPSGTYNWEDVDVGDKNNPTNAELSALWGVYEKRWTVLIAQTLIDNGIHIDTTIIMEVWRSRTKFIYKLSELLDMILDLRSKHNLGDASLAQDILDISNQIKTTLGIWV